MMIAAVMVIGAAGTAFAAAGDTTSHTAVLYKDGTYASGNPELSMGNGAMDGATITELGNGNYAVTVNFKSSFKPANYNITGYLKKVTLSSYTLNSTASSVSDLSVNQYMVTKTGSAVTGVTLVLGSAPTLPLLLDANFTINVLIMPVSASGDIVILN